MEIEVADWKPDASYYSTAQNLVDAKYMQGPAGQWHKWHNYHCSCKAGGCNLVRRGTLIVPPLVSMTYDASLPEKGAEFVVSPILLADGSDGLVELKNVWDIVVSNAVWTDSGRNMHGGSVSPSIHLHISVSLDQDAKQTLNSSYSQDILHALELFSPELFVLAEAGITNRRGLAFRWPDRNAMMNDPLGLHHGFAQIQSSLANSYIYIEWRLFEAAYGDWDYVERCIYLSATLTRAFLNRATLGKLMTSGYGHMYDEVQLRKVIDNNDLSGLLRMVNPQRLDALRQLCLEQIDDDNYGFHLLDELFQKAEKEFL
jgi:hypothetical protein